MDKKKLYNALVLRRKKCRCCAGLVNPSEYREYDSDEIGPWTRWQGNLDADILVVGQDWGHTGYFERWEGVDQPSSNPTNDNLQALLTTLGIHIGNPREQQRQQIFLTNIILCLKKRGGLQGPVEDGWFDNCSRIFFSTLVSIIKPRLVLALGLKVAQAILYCHDIRFRKSSTLRELISSPPFVLRPGTYFFPLYHCGRRGVNLNRSLDKQFGDWRRISPFLKKA